MKVYDSVVLVGGMAGVGQVESFCVFDVHQCQLPREKGRTKPQSPGRRCPRQGLRAPALRSALHTLNHSVHVNWNYRSC